MNDTVYGDSVVRRHARPVLSKGHPAPPRATTRCRRRGPAGATRCSRSRRRPASGSGAIFLPTNEWMQPVDPRTADIRAPLLKDGGRYGAFEEPRSARVRVLRRALPRRARASRWQQRDRESVSGVRARHLRDVHHRPVEYRRVRAPTAAGAADAWATAPLPGPTGAPSGVSIAGGSSLVVFKARRIRRNAWELIEFLSRAGHPASLLPAHRRSPRADRRVAGQLARRRQVRAPRSSTQLQRVRPTPKVPEWELLTSQDHRHLPSSRSAAALSTDRALAQLDADVDRILEKRRWILARAAHAPNDSAAAVKLR